MVKVTVIYGPPGTGKTTEMLRLLEQTVASGVSREQIAYLSFTKAAASEALDRMGLRSSKKVSTLHAQAYRLLKLSKDQVVDDEKMVEFGKASGIEISGNNAYSEREQTIGDELAQIHGFAVARELDPILVWSRYGAGNPSLFNYFIKSYEAWKKANGFIDFNDMLLRYAANPIDVGADVMFVDEAQDLSNLQWRALGKMIAQTKEVYVAGDDDQAIFEWSGAYAQGMADFEKEHRAKRVVLAKSWRLPRAVHRLGNSIVSGIRNRVGKEFEPRDAEGKVIRHGFVRGLRFDGRETLVLYRNHFNRKELEEVLIEQAIPYHSAVGRPAPLQSRHARAIRTYRAMQRGEDVSIADRDAVRRALSPPWTLPGALERPWQQVLNVAYFDYFNRVRWDVPIHVKIGSIHSAKGRESERVILYTGMTQRTIDSMIRNPDAEARVWYVGVTRAKEQLDIVEGQNGYAIPTN